jgi:hypothetical protein
MLEGLGKWLGKYARRQCRSSRSRSRFRPWCEVLEDRRLLATITVTTNADGAGVFTPGANPTDTTLRGAIANANSGDTITFAASLNGQTITLGGTELAFSKSLTITGPGASQLTVSGGNASRIFNIGGGTVNISGLNLTGGNDATVSGGAIFNSGTLTLTDNVVTNNTDGRGGGAIFSQTGTVNLIDSTISGNKALGGGGGGIYCSYSGLSLIDSQVTGNISYGGVTEEYGGTFGGGGILSIQGKVSVTAGSTISNNEARVAGGGGGIASYAFGSALTFYVANSSISDNSVKNASYADGGGIFIHNRGTVTIGSSGSTTTISNNYAHGSDGANGGGIFTAGNGTVTITNTTISQNTAAPGSGALFGPGSGMDGGYGGGGIYNNGSPLTIKDSTLSGNIAGSNANPSVFTGAGAIYDNAGTLSVNNSTISSNKAYGGEGAGGIRTFGTTLLANSVITGNKTFDSAGGGIVNTSGNSLTLSYSLLSGNESYAGNNGGGIANFQGSVGVYYSTISGNKALGGAQGGGLYMDGGTLNMSNSTVANNAAAGGYGGGIFNHVYTTGSSTLTNCTISGNTASTGGGIDNQSVVTPFTLTNTLVSGNTASDIQGNYSGGPNLVGGTAFKYLGPLANNGGPAIGNPNAPTYLGTMALLPGSPALNTGTTEVGPVDERGEPRSLTDPVTEMTTVDIGAFEHALGPTTQIAVVSVLPPVVAAGTTVSPVSIQTEDALGDFTLSSDTVVLTTTDIQGSFSPTSVVLNGQGQGSFSVTLDTSGTQTVFMTDQANPAITGRFSVTVNALQATHLVITGFPNEAAPGQAGSLTVFAEDPFGNVDPSDNNTTVSFSSSDPNAILPPPLTLTNGQVSFNATFQTVGTQTLTATQDNAAPEESIPSSATLTAVGIVTTSVSSTVYQPVIDPNAPQPQPVAAIYSGNPTPVPINGTTFLDYKVNNANSSAVAIVVFSFPAGTALPTLAFFDTSTNTWEPVAGSTIVPNSYRVNTTNDTITVTFDSSSFPTITQLTGTVFTVAIPATNTTPSSTVGVFPPVVSTDNNAAAVQASFVSSSSLSLTLTPLQQGAITTSQSNNASGGDGDSVPNSDVQALWDYFNDFWRWMLIGLDQPPSGKDVDVGAGEKPAGTGDGASGTGKPAGTGGGAAGSKPAGTGITAPQSRNDGGRDAAPLQSRSNDVRDAFFATAPPDTVFPNTISGFTAPTPAVEPPPLTTEEQGYGAAALLGLPGLGLMLEEIHKRRSRQRWRGSDPATRTR